MTPSRDFLVRQATLNGLTGFYEMALPVSGLSYVANDALYEISIGSAYGGWIIGRIRTEFTRLTARHDKWVGV